MSNNLIIIEGAGKINKIKSILGSDYDVMATGGHFRQLANSGLYNTGIDSDYKPTFEFSSVGIKNWKKIKDAVAKNKYTNIYIASDPDREGEAIGWHIYQSLPKDAKAVSKRITYNEITKSAINYAINHPREIDNNLVDAQFARQGYDKIFGFRASNYVQKNLHLKSIGRIQGVAVKFLGDKEQEINNYQPVYKQQIKPSILDENNIARTLSHVDEKGNIIRYDNISQVPKIQNPFICNKIATSNAIQERPYPPYITSSLLQDASRMLSITTKQVQSALQQLYQKGFISYPRTDSYALSSEFFNQLTTYLKNSSYKDYVRDDKLFFKDASNSQEGHECLRITHPEIKPNDPEIAKLGNNESKIYNLLYKRTMIQGLKNAIYNNIDYTFTASNNTFKITSKMYNYLGWRNYPDYLVSEDLIIFKEAKEYVADKIDVDEVNIAIKPSPYTEASLIKELEKKQIGRPSTYATFPTILLDRGYATIKNKQFVLSDEGRLLYKVINDNFKDFINYDYTKKFEEDLDKISQGLIKYNSYLNLKDKEIDKLMDSKINNDIKEYKTEINKPIISDHYCDVCKEYKMLKTSSNGNKYYICKNFKWDAKTKTATGCPIEWQNTPKTFTKKPIKKNTRRV